MVAAYVSSLFGQDTSLLYTRGEDTVMGRDQLIED
jgi:hypothetical protein